MKLFVLILLTFLIERHLVLSQFTFPGISNQGFQLPTLSTLPLNLNGFEQLNNQKSLDQLLYEAPPSILPANLVVKLIQEFIKNDSSQSLLASGLRQLSSNLDYSSLPKPIQQGLENAFKQFSKSVDASFDEGLARIRNSFGRFNETANSAIELAENLVTTGIQDINSNISKYNETIQSCVYDKASGYEEIIPSAGDEAQDCIHDKVSEIKEIMENGRTDIAAAVDGAQNLTTTIKQCSSSEAQENYHFGVIGCYISALINVSRETIMLPLQMTKRFGEIDMSIASARGDVIACTSTITETIAEQSMNVTAAIADCLITK